MTDKANDKDKLLIDAIKASIEFEKLMDKTDFDSWLDGACLCSWDEIPEKHCELLKKFIKDELLIENFEINWVKTEINKEIEGGKAIEVVTREKSLLLRLNDKKTKFELKIDDGKVRAYEFAVERKKNKRNICFTDSSKTLEYLGQSDGPFKNYEKNKTELKYICDQMKREVINNSSNSVVNSSLEEDPISKLFDAKIKRLEARICSNKNDEQEKYKEALHYLLSALNEHNKFCLQMKQNGSNKSLILEKDNALDMWLILLYNDLSICYAGLENSSMSRGYAEEASRIIRKEDSYKSFDKNLFSFSEIPTDKKQQKELLKYLQTIGYEPLSKSLENVKYILKGNNLIAVTKNGTRIAILEIKNDLCYFKWGDESDIKLGLVKKEDGKLNIYSDHDFVSSKLFELYTISLFNQALAERRSQQYNEAERNFKKIIKYAEENTHLLNFNYYSAILNLSDLYMDQGRGREALELLKKVINEENLEKENDIRYWNAYITKINALIDQSEYDDAEEILKKKFCEKGNSFTLVKRHRVTSTGFKALNCYARCKIEKVRNTLKIDDKNKDGELKKAKTVINGNIKIIIKRKQKGLETKAYKQLSDIYELWEDKKGNVIKCLTMFISETKIKNLDDFIGSPKIDNWIDKCDDLNALESFTDQIIKVMTDKSIDKYRDLLEKLKEKIIKECEDKNQLSRAGKSVTKIEKELGDKKGIKYKKDTFDKIFRSKDNLTKKEIITRLDTNEKEFDSALFKRSEMNKPEHIAEVIVLRRWNSFSPGLYRESIGSLGGGYLLRINKTLLKKGDEEEDRGDNKIAENKVQMSEESSDKKKDVEIENIVIDPGYNFLQNFRSEGFRVEDIDTIIVTHSHLDHCAELLPIMDLIFQINKRYKDYEKKERKKKRVSLCLSKGAYKKFSGYADDPDWQKQLKDVIILENLDEKTWIPFEGLRISAIQTPHMDLGGVNAIGLMIEIDGIVGENEENSKTVRLGFTGDTPWYTEIKENFDVCDLLCVHLGSIKYQEIGYTDDRNYLKSAPRKISSKEREEFFNKTYATANHLLFFGTLDFIKDCTNRRENNLIIVGEFGEELKYGLRTDLCKKLYKETKISCLPSDIGLYIGIKEDGTKKVRCDFCEEFVKPKEIKTFSYGREDALHYICKTCDNTLSELQKQAFIEHRVTRH